MARDPYQGPERRRHRAFLTRNTEYHLRDDECVAARNRRNGCWLYAHRALRRKLAGSLAPKSKRLTLPSSPIGAGHCLAFDLDGETFVTTVVVQVVRPDIGALMHYAPDL